MTSNSLALLNQLRPMSVGFNDIFERFEAMLGSNPTLNRGFTANYPPYNILQVGEGEYQVQVALAGFKKEMLALKNLFKSIRSFLTYCAGDQCTSIWNDFF